MLKKMFLAASLIAFMSTAAFAQEPATQAKAKQETHQVVHKHHAKTTRKASKKASSRKKSSKKAHVAKAKKADSTPVKKG